MADIGKDLERLARALDEASHEFSLAFVDPHSSDNEAVRICQMVDREKRIRQVRAVLEELKNVSETMLDSGDAKAKLTMLGQTMTLDSEPIFVAMLDSILSQDGEG